MHEKFTEKIVKKFISNHRKTHGKFVVKSHGKYRGKIYGKMMGTTHGNDKKIMGTFIHSWKIREKNHRKINTKIHGNIHGKNRQINSCQIIEKIYVRINVVASCVSP